MKKRKKRIFFRTNYRESWNYLNESKKFIYAIIVVFFLSFIFGFFVPTPDAVAEKIFEIINELIEETEGMSQTGLISFIFLNNLQSSFFGMIFGFFFGKGSVTTGTVALINGSNSELAQNMEKAMTDSNLFKITRENNVEKAKEDLKKNKVVAIINIPNNFGSLSPNAPTQIKVIYDPGNAQANSIVLGFLDKFLTNTNFNVQKVKPIFSIEEEKTTTKEINYFDFVLVGLIGMALMNSSVQSVAIGMAKYREEKILKRIVTTPLKTYKFIIGEVISRLVLNLVQISLILIIGVYLFNAHIYGNIFLVYLFGLLGAILFQLLGFSIASFSKTIAAAEGMAVAVTIPMMFLAGVFFPIDQLPKWLYSVVQYMPLAPFLRMIRAVALEGTSPFDNPINIIIVMSWIVFLLLLSSWKFRLSEE